MIRLPAAPFLLAIYDEKGGREGGREGGGKGIFETAAPTERPTATSGGCCVWQQGGTDDSNGAGRQWEEGRKGQGTERRDEEEGEEMCVCHDKISAGGESKQASKARREGRQARRANPQLASARSRSRFGSFVSFFFLFFFFSLGVDFHSLPGVDPLHCFALPYLRLLVVSLFITPMCTSLLLLSSLVCVCALSSHTYTYTKGPCPALPFPPLE